MYDEAKSRPGSQPASEERPVYAQLSRQESIIAGLTESLSDLRSRLSFAMAPSSPTVNEKVGVDRAETSTLASQVETHNSQLKDLTERVSEMLSLLEI